MSTSGFDLLPMAPGDTAVQRQSVYPRQTAAPAPPNAFNVLLFLWRVCTTLALGAVLVLAIVIVAELASFPKTLTDGETAVLHGIADALDAHTCPTAHCEIALSECWQTLDVPNGHYVLTQALTCINATAPLFGAPAIRIGAHGVQIDGRGYTLVAGPNNAIYSLDYNDLYVHDLVLQSPTQQTANPNVAALLVQNATGVRIEHVQMFNYSSSLRLLYVRHSRIAHTHARGEMRVAVATSIHLGLFGCEHVSVVDSSFHDNDTSANGLAFGAVLSSVGAPVYPAFVRGNAHIRFERVSLVGYTTGLLVMATSDSDFVDVHVQRSVTGCPCATIQVGSSSLLSTVSNLVFDRLQVSQSAGTTMAGFGMWIIRAQTLTVRDSQLTGDVDGASSVPQLAVGHPAGTIPSNGVVLRRVTVNVTPTFNQTGIVNSAFSFRSVAGGSITMDDCDAVGSSTPLSILDANGLITVRNSRLSQGREAGIAASSGASGALRLVLERNVIDNNCATGVWLAASVTNAVLVDNKITHNGAGLANGMSDSGSGTLLHASNVQHANSKTCSAPVAFTGASVLTDAADVADDCDRGDVDFF